MNAKTLAVCLSPLLLTGCVIGNSGTLQVSRHVTLGQELSDLKSAYDNGAITASEYEVLRAKVFDAVDALVGTGDWEALLNLDDEDPEAADASAPTHTN